MTFWLLCAFAYLLGSVPFGLLMGRLFADVDVRELGSGNIGATNVNRVLGRKLGAATLLCDILKGTFVVILARILLPRQLSDDAWVGFAAFLGHCFPIYLKFRGGKGVATMFGILAPISIYAALIAMGIWLVVVKVSKISALGALTACLTIPFSVYYFQKDLESAFVFFLVMLIVLYRHKENIKRMREGRELGLQTTNQ